MLLRAAVSRGGIIRLLSSQKEVQHDIVEPSRFLQLWSVACLLYDLNSGRPVQRTLNSKRLLHWEQLIVVSPDNQHLLSQWCHLKFIRADGNPLEKMDELLSVRREKFLTSRRW